MKKVLIISQNFYPEIGSAGNRMKNIYLLLKQRGFDVTVLTTEPTYPNRKIYEDNKFWDNDGLNDDQNIFRIKVTNTKYSRSLINRLIYYLEVAIRMLGYIIKNKGEFSKIIVTSPPIFIGIVGLFAKKYYNAKLILDIRDLWPESLKGVGVFNNPIIIRLFRVIERVMYSRANEIIVNSKGFIPYISSKLKAGVEKITYIPNGATKEEIGSKNNSTFQVIYAGNIGLAQDDSILKQLAKELYQRRIGLTIIGYGLRKDSLIEYCQEHNLTNVTFLTPTTREESLKITSEHQVGIVSLEDKDVFKTVLPGKIIDYMTCGIPIVGSVSGIAKEVILAEQVGFVSESNDVKDLIYYIDTIRGNPLLRQEMSENGNRYVHKDFLWETNIDPLIDILES
ncbi:glycosyltransferase family 4 protein [Ornithinibacillus sp. BX22]|uniref:Glycosyltransferase family 4 protein n=1 Tax=Ornithinibacillus hominis TaxID=2763055 RepID=A0A923L3B6_9BACI|nr:glycosyltransferase family 4 protein [Ornithinibacillus hominis]MBC5635717.1 glycosyltransferase family 4 protein [Ornithinibacillus hominis]